jgi:zinc protease
MKRSPFVLFAVLLAASSAVFAQEQPQPKPEPNPEQLQPKPEPKPDEAAPVMPSSEQILDKYVEALGGKSALEKVTSRVANGNFDVPAFGASGTVQMFAKAPSKATVIVDVPGFGIIQQSYDGKTGWDQMPQMGLRELSGSELDAKKLDTDFYRPLHLKDLYPTRTVKGKQKVGERDAWLIEAKPATGTPEKWYFDAENGLLVRQDAQRDSAQGSAEIQVFFQDYRDVDGMKIPFEIKQVLPGMEITIKLEQVKHNVEVDDAKFAKPAN